MKAPKKHTSIERINWTRNNKKMSQKWRFNHTSTWRVRKSASIVFINSTRSDTSHSIHCRMTRIEPHQSIGATARQKWTLSKNVVHSSLTKTRRQKNRKRKMGRKSDEQKKNYKISVFQRIIKISTSNILLARARGQPTICQHNGGASNLANASKSTHSQIPSERSA